MAFDGFWRFWWQIFSIKAVKPHQTSSNIFLGGLWRFWWQIFSIKAIKLHQTSSKIFEGNMSFLNWLHIFVKEYTLVCAINKPIAFNLYSRFSKVYKQANVFSCQSHVVE